MTERGLKNINVFIQRLQTFFFIFVTFFNVFFWNVFFYINGRVYDTNIRTDTN